VGPAERRGVRAPARGRHHRLRLTPTRVTAKRKLSQNKPDEVIENVILELSGDGEYAEPRLAAEMRRAHDARLAARDAATAAPAAER
jgi:transcriptional regulator